MDPPCVCCTHGYGSAADGKLSFSQAQRERALRGHGNESLRTEGVQQQTVGKVRGDSEGEAVEF